MLTIIMGILFVLSFIIYKIWDKNGQSYTPDWLDFLTIAFGVLFALVMILWPLFYFVTKSNIRQIKTLKATIETARIDSNTIYERAALTTKIIETLINL